ncbi:hypothetical protein AHF37_07062 [Paragonimus kellicotti]|nr:hypothetical protein AHF37_07062 [Paragonimus kellicotti]
MHANLNQFAVKNFPAQLYYIPDFITEEEELKLHKHIYAVPLPKWVVLSGRRLQNWGGIPHPKGMLAEKIPEWLHTYMDRVSNLGAFGGHKANHALINEYEPGQGITPHHDGPLYYPVVATINLGSYGVLDFYRPIKDVMNSAAGDQSTNENLAQLTPYDSRYIGSALLQPRSLNLVAGELYTHYMHGIDFYRSDRIYLPGMQEVQAQPDDHRACVVNWNNCGLEGDPPSDALFRGTRISITIRYVPKISKLNVGLLLNKK